MPTEYSGTYKPTGIYYPPVSDASDDLWTGQLTVAVPGTAQIGPDVDGVNGFYVRALDDNIAPVYVGNDGSKDISSATGYQLSPGESIIAHILNMNALYVDAVSAGDGICWLKA